MPHPDLDPDKRYTYADYYSWDDDKRWELIDGKLYPLSSSPGTRHQRALGGLSCQFGKLKISGINLLHAPFDVCFVPGVGSADNEIQTVVQPDLLVVLDKNKFEERCCMGVPDLLVEVLTKESAAHDLKTKYELYQRYGVKEYWIVHPNDQTVLVFKLGEDGMYGRAAIYTASDVVPVPLLGELTIDLNEVFAE